MHNNYLKTFYNFDKRPQSDYPKLLVNHLSARFFQDYFDGHQYRGKVLDVACGRGDQLRAFSEIGFVSCGVDRDETAKNFSPDNEVKVGEADKLPYGSECFDIVFNKSIIEHLHEPEKMLEEIHRVLKPGGVVVTMCPSWTHTRWGPFYLDHTHVTPFTLPSLRDIHTLCGFKKHFAQHFRQLPLLWENKMLLPFFELIRLLPIPYNPMSEYEMPNKHLNKVVRFSNEVMLLYVGEKHEE